MAVKRKYVPRKKTGRKYTAKQKRAYYSKLRANLGIHLESKYCDTNTAFTLANTKASVGDLFLNNIPIGDDSISRTGDTVKLTEIDFRAHIHLNSAMTGGSVCRLTVVWQKFLQSNLDNPGSALLDGNQLYANTGDVESPLNNDLVGVKILLDKKYYLNANSNQVEDCSFKYFFSQKGGISKWADYDTTGGDPYIIQGALFVFAWTDTVTNRPVMSTYTRVRFNDA